jgi:hypothetical protein
MNLNGAVNLNASRIKPNMEPKDYRTFSMKMPRQTHRRRATCEEAGCEAYRHGWVTTVDVGSELGQRQYHYITHDKTRRYTTQHVGEGLYKFIYGPGQQCFGKEHTIPLERPALFVVRDGDWRKYISPPRQHTKAEFWVEEMQQNFDWWRSITQRG